MIPALIDCLATFYQSGDLTQAEAIARSILIAVPEDLVALQFLGLVFHLNGRTGGALKIFGDVARKAADATSQVADGKCEEAHVVILREATKPNSGLADGWHRLGVILQQSGFKQLGVRAFRAAQSSRGSMKPDRV